MILKILFSIITLFEIGSFIVKRNFTSFYSFFDFVSVQSTCIHAVSVSNGEATALARSLSCLENSPGW